MTPATAQILLVDDSPTDVLLTREALRDAGLVNELVVAEKGDEALRLLTDPGGERPNLILLDLNLPGMSGLELLRRIKDCPELRSIPVVVLTTSTADEDVTSAYRFYVNAYVRKPVSFQAFMEAVREIGTFWLSLVVLPELVDG